MRLRLRPGRRLRLDQRVLLEHAGGLLRLRLRLRQRQEEEQGAQELWPRQARCHTKQ